MKHFLVSITVINGERSSQTETFIEAGNREEAAGGALALEVSEGAKKLSWDVAESGDCETLYEVSRILEVDEEDLATIRKYFTVYNCSASLIETTFLTSDEETPPLRKLTKEEFELLCFTHQGSCIHNPFYDESLRFEVEPEDHYGFKCVSTGGGCEALVRNADKDGYHLMLTDSSGCNVPSEGADRPDDVLVGIYNREDGEELLCVTLSQILEAFDEL